MVATVLVDTESRADEHIYEEFKGTANMEVHLERSLLDRRIFPSLNLSKSTTRREELLLKPEVLSRAWVLRKLIGQMNTAESMELLVEHLAKTKSNEAFLERMADSSASPPTRGGRSTW